METKGKTRLRRLASWQDPLYPEAAGHGEYKRKYLVIVLVCNLSNWQTLSVSTAADYCKSYSRWFA